MRKFSKIQMILLSVFVMSSVIGFLSCENEIESNRNPSSTNENLSLLIPSNGNCQDNCIEVGGPYYVNQDQVTVSWGGPQQNNNSKVIDIRYYNTEDNFVLEVKSSSGWSDLVIDGVSSWTNGPVVANSWGTYSFPLTSGWQACDAVNFSLSVSGNGPPASFSVSYNLFPVCSDGCDTSFSGEAISCDDTREAVYTFIASEDQSYIKIQGGLTNFTGADAVVTVSGGNLVVSQWTPGNSTNRIIKVEGDVAACEEVMITIQWNSTNSGGIITGDWSVKGSDGSDIAPAVAGLSCD